MKTKKKIVEELHNRDILVIDNEEYAVKYVTGSATKANVYFHDGTNKSFVYGTKVSVKVK